MSSRKQPTEEKMLLDVAEGLLRDIRDLGSEIGRRESAYHLEASALAEKHQDQVAAYRAELAELEKLLVILMKKNRRILFEGQDKVTLDNGVLIHSRELKVSIPRDALAMCEKLGLDEVIKIAKSIDREAVEKWPDEKLLLIGARRKPKELFSYDISGRSI